MSRRIPELAGIAFLALAATALAEPAEPAYHDVIQSGKTAIPAQEFQKLEGDAYTGFDSAKVYPPLIRAFAATTERVWAVIYGEVFANLTDVDAAGAEIGALVFRLYDEAIDAKSANEMTVALTREWTLDAEKPELPFEMNFEMSTIPGLAGSFEPLTIRALADARAQQLAIWRERKLPDTELLGWQERIAQAGHFDAYSHWLFRSARPPEFEAWQRSNRAAYEAWIQWRAANPMRLDVPDFHRLLLSAEDPERELLSAGRALLDRKNPELALLKSFDRVIQALEARHAGDKETFYCARGPVETLMYLAKVAATGQSVSVLTPTWSDAYYLKAYALLELGRMAEAREALGRALELSPENSMYLGEMAYTYQLEKQWTESIARYEAAEEAAKAFSPPDVKASELSRALRGQGYALIELGRLDEAETIYREAIASDPEDRNSARELQYIEQVRAKKR